MHRRHLLRATFGLLTARTAAILPAVMMPAAAQAAGAKKAAAAPNYIQMPVLTVFTPGRGYKHGTLSVEIGLHADTAKMGEKMAKYIPRLRDTYVTTLQAYARTLSPRAIVDTQHVAQQLQAATDRVVGAPGLKVLLGSVILN